MDSAKMIKRIIRFVIPLYLLSLLLSGCATKRWAEPLTEEEGTEIASIINKIQVAEKSCPDSLEADARIFWKTPGSNAGITSYLQLHSPSFAKLIITNPLGMMMYAFASDGKTFQSLDSIEQLHIRGNARTLMIRMRMPVILAEGDWFSYITGRLPSDPFTILEISKDKTDTTAWILLEQSKFGKTEDRRWIHIDTEKQKLLGYLFLDANEKTIAEISYTEQNGSGDICQPKEKIHITDLPWGSEIRIELQNISTATQFSPSDFTLPVPVGYFKQLQP